MKSLPSKKMRTNMTTTIQLDPQTAKALAEHTAALGLSVEEYLKKHFAGTNGPITVANADHWLDALSEGLPELSPLPHDFSTRDIYTDHD